jgi:uncharacterized membrane protein (UPF0136 family)
MKNVMYVVWAYALLLIIGGIIGFVKAGSLPSIIASAMLAGFLFRYGYGIAQGNALAYNMTIGTMVCIFAFFVFRYIKTQAFMPAGMMIIVTVLTLAYVWVQKGSFKANLS